MNRPIFKRAFTLVEMLIVIAIIALLAGIIMTSLTGSKSKSRDGKRIADINQIQSALEQYFDRCGQYPAQLNVSQGAGVCPASVTLATFISTIPTPPGGTYDYAINTDKTDFVLHVTLENISDYVKDGLPAATYGTGGIAGWTVGSGAATFTCDNSASSLQYCVGTK